MCSHHYDYRLWTWDWICTRESKCLESKEGREAAGRLEGLWCLLGVEMSQSLLRRQTKLKVNKRKGKKRETEENKSFVLSQRLQPNQLNHQGSAHRLCVWCMLLTKQEKPFGAFLLSEFSCLRERGKEMKAAGRHSLKSSVWTRAVLKSRASSTLVYSHVSCLLFLVFNLPFSPLFHR